VTKLAKKWVWDPRSGIRKKNLLRTPDPGVKKVSDPGSGSATLPPPPHKFRDRKFEVSVCMLKVDPNLSQVRKLNKKISNEEGKFVIPANYLK
jgi:hypothetical protein